MSDILQRTMASLPGLFSNVGPAIGQSASRTFGISNGMLSFIQNMSSVKSKYAEDQLVQRELSLQKQKLTNPTQTTAQKRDSLVRLLYCHLLGYDVSFAYIHAVKLAQQGSILEKRVGYLACAAFLNDSDELAMLLINTILKDLSSTNILTVCTALMAAGHLVSSEMIPSLLPSVKEKLKHSKEIIRRKAVLCLRAFIMKVPALSAQLKLPLNQALGDKDPGVMWAALEAYHQLILSDGTAYADLVPVLVDILEQIVSRKLPSQFDYHTVPSPWLTISVLKLLACLGKANESTKNHISPVLQDVLQRTEPTHTAGLAIIYETLLTIAVINADSALMSIAANCVSRFLSAKQINLRYVGIKVLSALVQVDDRYALSHQSSVIDCLEHEDVTIQKTTLHLLCNMANPVNRQVICDRLLEYAQRTTDHFSKVDIVTKILDIADRLSDSTLWYIDQVTKILDTSGDVAPAGTDDKLIQVIKFGLLDDKSCAEVDRIQHALSLYWQTLKSETISDQLLRVAIWTIGEFCHLDTTLSPDNVISCLTERYKRCAKSSSRKWILSALCKRKDLIGHPENVLETLRSVSDSDDKNLQQRLHELAVLCASPSEIKDKLSLPSLSLQQMDFSLSFLDSFVSEALESGAMPYRTAALRLSQMVPQKETEASSVVSSLIITPSEAHSFPGPALKSNSIKSSSLPSREGSDSGSAELRENLGLRMKGVKVVWGKEGLIKPSASASMHEGDSTLGVFAPHSSASDSVIDNQEAVDSEAARKAEQKKLLADALFGSIAVSQKGLAKGEEKEETAPVGLIERSISPDSIESQSEEELCGIQSPNLNLLPDIGAEDSLSPASVEGDELCARKPSSVLLKSWHAGSSSSHDQLVRQYLRNKTKSDDLGVASNLHSVDLPLSQNATPSEEMNVSNRLESAKNTGGPDADESFSGTASFSHLSTDSFSFDGLGSYACEESESSKSREESALSNDRTSEVTLTKDSEDGKAYVSDETLVSSKGETAVATGKLIHLHDCEMISIFCQKCFCLRSLRLLLTFYRKHSFDPVVFREATVSAVNSSQICQTKFVTNQSLAERISLKDLSFGQNYLKTILDVTPVNARAISQTDFSPAELLLSVPTHGIQTSIRIPVHLSDFIRPSECSLQDFAISWVSFQPECRKALSCVEQNVAALVDMLTSRCRLHVVQISGQECILAGQILDDEQQTILLHIKLTDSHTGSLLHLWMKSYDQQLLDRITPAIITLLSS